MIYGLALNGECITQWGFVARDEDFSVKPQFWLDRELAKVKDPNRRQWLAEKVFAGEEGYQKFLKVMHNRKGAHEFETGEWQKTLPKYSKGELELKRRPCIGGCGDVVFPPRFTPWGELFEDWTPICSKCKAHIKPKERNMSDNKTDASKDVQDILAQLEAKKQNLKADLKTTLDEAKTQLNVLLTPQLGYTFENIFSDDAFADIVDAFKIQLTRAKTRTRTATGTGKKRQAKKSKLKKGGLKEAILKLMSDGQERKRPAINSALKEQDIKTTNLYGMSGIEGLVKDGKLTVQGKGRAAVYRIAK